MALVPQVVLQFEGPTGVRAFAEAYFTQKSTTTPVVVYQDDALTVPHASPVVADDEGIFPPIYFNSAVATRVRVIWQGGDLTHPDIDVNSIGDGSSSSSSSGSAPFWVPTVAALVALLPDSVVVAEGQPVKVMGFAAPGDGSFKNLQYNSTDTTNIGDPGYGRITVVDLVGRRWARQEKGYTIDLRRDMNCMLNNTTDDTQNVQAAFDQAVKWGTGTRITVDGLAKITAPVVGNFDAIGYNLGFGLNIQGIGQGLSGFVSWLPAGGRMISLGDSATKTPNVALNDVAFRSNTSPAGAGGEDYMLYMGFCLDARLKNVDFYGGRNQLLFAKPQGALIKGCSFKGFLNGALSGVAAYGSTSGISYIPDATFTGGQNSRIIGTTVRDFRNATGTAIGVNFATGSGQEHTFAYSTALENNDLSLNVDVPYCSFHHNACETGLQVAGVVVNNGAGVFDTLVQVGKNALVAAFETGFNTLSGRNAVDLRMYDMVNYEFCALNNDTYITPNGHVVRWQNHNNRKSQFIGNKFIDPRVNVDYVPATYTDGKIEVLNNIENSTHEGYYVQADSVATPSVANLKKIISANPAATAISDFLNGHPGMWLEYEIGADVGGFATTITNNTNIQTIGGGTLSNKKRYLFRARGVAAANGKLVWDHIQTSG